MTTHSSILAWRIPWTEEPGGLYSPWGHKESDMAERLTLSDAGDVGLIPGQEAKIHVPHSQKQKKKPEPKKRNNIITNSIETLQMVHIRISLKINK